MKRIAYKTTVAKLVAGLDAKSIPYYIASGFAYAHIRFDCPFSKKHSVSFSVKLSNGQLESVSTAEFSGRGGNNNFFLSYGEKYQQKLFNYLQLAF